MKIDTSTIGGSYDISSALSTVTNSEDGKSFKSTLENAQADGDEEAIKDVCKQFEALFIDMLMKQMRKTIEDGGLTEKSQARETFEGMLDEEMASSIAENGGIGIADLMAKALMRETYGSTEDTDDSASVDENIMDLVTSGT
jgi:flagellar protein FlgJ